MSGTLNIDDIKGLLSSMAPSNPKGTLNAYGTPIINTGTNDLSYDQVKTNGLLQQLAQQELGNRIQKSQFASQPQIVGQTPDGQNIWSNPMTGGFHTDTGQVMADPNAVTQGAALARAQQGLNPGQSNEAQLKSDMMGKLSNAILNLPKEDQHTAYERAVGVLVGQGKLDIHDLPSWEQGGRDFMLKLKGIEAQGAMGAEEVKGQYGLQTEALKGQYGVAGEEAKAAPELMKSQVVQQASQQGNQPGTNPVINQLQMVLNNPLATPAEKDSALTGLAKLGITGLVGSGLPVGDPITGRAATKYTGAAEAINDLDELGKLLKENPNISIRKAKIAGNSGLNGLLKPVEQRYNTLTTDLNDFIKSLGGEDGTNKALVDHLTSLLPTYGDNQEERMKKLENLRTEYVRLKTALDPSGHIENILTKQGLVDPRSALGDTAGQTLAPQVQAPAPSYPGQLSEAQKMAILARRQQATPQGNPTI